MLKYLKVIDFALIEELELDINSNMVCITGETGSGKSLILDALASILGSKCNTINIRQGAKKYIIEAIFDLEHNFAAIDWLNQKEISIENHEIILRKELSLDGKSRIQISGVIVPAHYLKELGTLLAEIHSQHDQFFILDKKSQLHLLDDFASSGELRDHVKQAFHTYREMKKKVEEIEFQFVDKQKKIEYLKFQIDEIQNANLHLDEEEKLSKEETFLVSGEKNIENYNSISHYLEESEESILKSFVKILQASSKIAKSNPQFQSTKDELDDMYCRLKEISHEIDSEKEDIFYSPDRLDTIQGRLDQINRLKKKYGKSISEVLTYCKSKEEELETLTNSEDRLATMKIDLMNQCGQLSSLAIKLSKHRKDAIYKLESEVQKELAELGMKDAKLQIVIRWDAADSGDVLDSGKRYMVTESGLDEVDFYFSANMGEKPRPLRKIASGGEISRIMLALKRILGQKSVGKVLVFDEIDSGTGGETAAILATKLKQISQNHQILLITHLQQIAAQAEQHIKAKKEIKNGRTITQVSAIEKSERALELAKMISGENYTKASLEHAKELLRKVS